MEPGQELGEGCPGTIASPMLGLAADHQAAHQCDHAGGHVCWDQQQVCSAQGISMDIVLQWLHHPTGYQRAFPAACMVPAHVLPRYHFPATAEIVFI